MKSPICDMLGIEFPNFATIVTSDEHDEGAPSNLSERPDVFLISALRHDL